MLLKRNLVIKKKKHKNDLLHVKDAISITQLNLRGIMARLKDEKRAAKKPATNEKVIPKAKLQQPTDDVCSVCCDHHLMCDVLQTSCGHQIGKECYQMWVSQCRSKHTPVTCTVCRRVKPKIFGFRERKTKKNAQMVA